MTFREFLKRDALLICSVICVSVLLTGILAIWVNKENNKPPSYQEMRKYVISHMPDEEIRRLRNDAEKESKIMKERMEREEAEEKAREYRKYDEIDKLCSDIAYKEKNIEKCSYSMPSSIFGRGGLYIFARDQPWYVENIYEGKIMARCQSVTTRKEAQKAGCIDPD